MDGEKKRRKEDTRARRKMSGEWRLWYGLVKVVKKS